ncbi:MAG: hypothetical protein HOW73_02840 [Polyangiaceae bacterium]|nr:hypothetical protein [Polyangiaceae bacterium]
MVWLSRGICALVVAASLTVLGCAGMAEYPLGIPSSSSPKFYASMEAVAAKHGMQISRHAESLNIETEDGEWLQYMQRNGVIVLVVVANTDGLSDDQIELRKSDLRKLSDELVREARQTAAEASAFD